MAITNMFLTDLAGEIGSGLANSLDNTHAFLSNVTRVIVPKGVSSVQCPIPGAMTSTTRVAGGALTTVAPPTDTAVTFTPSTEYIANIAQDRITASRSAVDFIKFYAPLMRAKILQAVGAVLWAKYTSVTTNVVGVDNAPALPDLLASAYQKLLDAQCPMGNVKCIIGGAEGAVWKPALVWNSYGPEGQGALGAGIIGKKYGFDVMEDQQRASAGSVGYNIAYNPAAFGIGFRSETVPSVGAVLGQATDTKTGITVFTEAEGMDDSTGGKGNRISAWVVADVEVIYESWACIVKGSI